MSDEQKKDESTTPTAPKPGVLSLSIKEKGALYAAYMPFLKGGGLFIPTNRTYRLGEEVFMLLSLLDDPNKLKVVGHVTWVTPVTQGVRPQGIGIQFSEKDGGIEARNKIEALLGGALKSARPTHTM
ncbi:type IV pilus assembly protein PilZ [Novimethylophilus kurashikiensis]|uniref:Type IV pilus assembly protein PilZ n=1 Tax=Novimethylophilus kurashikiensis TaxID=1825523 RepID=A0A2R5F811_9PROT|nr:PilZ domain-containing protein [Novimethylophilus kurashikiensis]GBG13043.1 type IV pilus assembly protein PilZ [Novimethylophilus kurashikiensis]